MLIDFLHYNIDIIGSINSSSILTKDITIAVGIAGGALTTAIGVLWKTVVDLSKKQIDMSKELGKLEGKQDGIRELSYKVLDTVHVASSRNNNNNNNNNYNI